MKKINKLHSTEKLQLGGVQQYLIIRGMNIENPVLLLLHGGTSETAHFVKFNHALEEDYTVVYWEQRGEGKSYVKGSDSSLLTLERYVEDIHELTQMLKEQFNQEKIYLLAHSFGTVLGMKTVEKYPEDYLAYIAVSQVADSIKSDNIAYDILLQTANGRDLKKLQKIERVTKENLQTIDFTKRSNEMIKLSMKYGGLHHDKSFLNILKTSLLPILTFKEYSFKEKLKAMTQHEERILIYYKNSLIETIAKVDVPIYFIHGVDDLIVNYDLTKEYFEKIEAPYKKFISFEKSAHLVPFEEGNRFNEVVKGIREEK
jgi:pimeloyl-ACP methyl ester carboxylesterase